MTLKQLMSIKNSKILVKALSYEAAEDMLKVHVRHLHNETSVLRERYNETVFLRKNESSSLSAKCAEMELVEIQNILKEKLHQLNHVSQLLENLPKGMMI